MGERLFLERKHHSSVYYFIFPFCIMFILHQGAAAFPGLGPPFPTRQHVPQTSILWDHQRVCLESFSEEE